MGNQVGLSDFFEQFLQREPFFINKKVLQGNYIPDAILHRTKQLEFLANILAPALRLEKPSNVFIYGKTGTGKTLVTQYTLDTLSKAAERRNLKIKQVYVNCKLKKVSDTEYRIVTELARAMGEELPATGLPTEEVWNKFLAAVDAEEQVVIIVLDEIDRFVSKVGDEILYNLTRINSNLKKGQVSLIGISNDIRFIENIDARVRSSLGEEDIIFPPYNAAEIQDILEKRTAVAFRPNVIKDGVLSLCAGYAAREHGDARRALDLLRVAGETAEREHADGISQEHIKKAEDRIERDRILETVEVSTKQSQLVLYAILGLLQEPNKKIETGEIYETYLSLCRKSGHTSLTQRRVSDLIGELDMQGLINAKVISKGRYGRTRQIYLTIQDDMIAKILEKLKGELN
ncbi:MAG: ORC1-type DNA replication protein [DPANN group archaeon]|nr:ORC1-type DNA replication protein [DPANN group archaeon]